MRIVGRVNHDRDELRMQSRFNSFHNAGRRLLEIPSSANLPHYVAKHLLSVIPLAEKTAVDRFEPFPPLP
jgi:hypothetical protein